MHPLITLFSLLLLCIVQPSLAALVPLTTAAPANPAKHSAPDITPFGAELFQGNFAKGTYDELNQDYTIMPGDRITVRMWGAHNADGIFEVDAQGVIFLPEIGPIKVSDIKNSQLNGVIKDSVRSVFINNVEVYTNLLNTQPVAIYVTGFVNRPGRYAGGPTDSVLYYLDMAGGIDAERGSYRDIRILRNGKLITPVDLYPFILEGQLPRPRLNEGDVILVGERGVGVVSRGQVRRSARFEFPANTPISGQQMAQLATPLNKVSHTSIVGSRQGAPYNVYLSLTDFYQATLEDGDTVDFHADTPGTTIMVGASGAIVGASRYPVKKDTRLKSLLYQIPVEQGLANLDGIHIKRRSVAERQKKSLDESLRRLEYSSLTATSQSVDEANLRVREAEMISQFVVKAREIQPEGTLVVSHKGEISDLYLEDGDIIVIPAKSDVVTISGEVMIPTAVVHLQGMNAEEYVERAGGFSNRADEDNILVAKPNGEVIPADDTQIVPGDQLLVMPRFESKNLQLVKDIMQILYQLAIATHVVIDIGDD